DTVKSNSLDSSIHAQKSWSNQMDDEDVPYRSTRTPTTELMDTQ
ncbi:5502_t:CDS:1, partial [Funneliformis mosseae]